MGKYNQKLFDSIHLEPQRASDNEDARDYCKKEGDFIELGEFVQERSNAGKRMDLAQIVREYDDYFEALQLVKPHEIQYFKELWRNKPKKLINRDGVSLRPWQEFIFKKYIACKNDRDIVIVCDRVGNTGKTFFCNWLEDVWGAFITSPMKSQDILYAYNNEDIICFDYPRSKDDNFMFSGTIEVLKNGRGRAGKYEGRHIHRNTPASVILFTNSTTGIEIAEHFSNDRIILCYFDSFIYRKMKNDHPYYRYEIFTPQDLITPPSK